MIGMFAISKAGHDKGRMYLVVGQEKDLVLLADGKTRTMENPKRKKTKHIQIINMARVTFHFPLHIIVTDCKFFVCESSFQTLNCHFKGFNPKFLDYIHIFLGQILINVTIYQLFSVGNATVPNATSIFTPENKFFSVVSSIGL